MHQRDQRQNDKRPNKKVNTLYPVTPRDRYQTDDIPNLRFSLISRMAKNRFLLSV